MDESINDIIEEAQMSMDEAISFLKSQLLRIRTGKASPDILDSVAVDYYGTVSPINQVGNVSVADARMLTVTPWDKSMIPTIEKAIREAGLGLNPSSDGDLVRVPIPALNEERRKQLAKQARDQGEDAKISIRNARKTANDQLKQLQKDGASEDAVKGGERSVQDVTNSFSKKVDEIVKEKEGQIMTV